MLRDNYFDIQAVLLAQNFILKVNIDINVVRNSINLKVTHLSITPLIYFLESLSDGQL